MAGQTYNNDSTSTPPRPGSMQRVHVGVPSGAIRPRLRFIRADAEPNTGKYLVIIMSNIVEAGWQIRSERNNILLQSVWYCASGRSCTEIDKPIIVPNGLKIANFRAIVQKGGNGMYSLINETF